MRKSSKIPIKPVLFIACEGTSTEYQYFESWAQSEEALHYYERIDVYPEETEKKPKTTPYELFLIAKKALDIGSANFAWVVFDKDNHPKLPETFTEALPAGVKIAFSSRSFEEWVILHFEKNNTLFNATECKDENDKPIDCGSHITPQCAPLDCLTGHIRRQNFIANYSKKKTFDLYNAIEQRTEIGIVNSAWQRYKNNCSLNLPAPQFPHPLNPYCNVDQLIFKLTERSDKIEWGALGQDITLDVWTVNISTQEQNLAIKILHKNNNPELLRNIQTSILAINDELIETPVNFIRQNYIVQNNGSTDQLLYRDDIVEIIINNVASPYILFHFDFNRIFVDLNDII